MRLVTDLDVVQAQLRAARIPLDKIRAAIELARLNGIRILHGDYGVIAGGFDWMLDRRRRPEGVHPLGALVLAYQPPVGTDMPEPAAQVLEVGLAYVQGFADGFDRTPDTTPIGSVAKRLYGDGLEAGFELRFELTRRCGRCGSRHFRQDQCYLCEERRGDGLAQTGNA